ERGDDRDHVELQTDGQTLDAAALSLAEAVPGGIRECNNHCEFCFIRGLPQGLRRSLYVFDDDYRYSFLWGNFLTLTNLDDADLAALHPGVQSVSLVPVGLTRYSRVKNIRRPNRDEALAAVEQCERWQQILRTKLGMGFVYASDELYLLAGREALPTADAYD